MVFEGVDSQFVEFRIINYEFPNHIDGDWDSNWLSIYLNVKSSRTHWQTINACLTTWEVLMLINWFEKLSDNLDVDSFNVNFTEPNLSFTLLNDVDAEYKMIRIYFDLESSPQDQNSNWFVDIYANNSDLKVIVIGLQSELSKFPERVNTCRRNVLQK
jgi:hypothetical protein